MSETFADLERSLRRDPAARNVGAFAPRDQLEPACRSLLDASQVVICTGFPVLSAEGELVPETDGPVGARAVGDALARLDIPVRYLTDSLCAGLLRALDCTPLDVLDLEPGDRERSRAYLDQVQPSHLLAVERPGRALNGGYLSMRGQVLGGISALDELFLEGRVTSIGVGDGGNEIGMGGLRDRVISAVPHGDRIASVIATDWAVVAGVSTWGAWGVAAGLAVLSERDLLPASTAAEAQLRAIVQAGAVDGVTKRLEATLDGLPWDTHARVLEDLRSLGRR